MKIIEVKGLKFHVRAGASDEKTIQEVVEKDAYEKRGFKILPGEKWIDLGGNIGAFTVLAASKGAHVTTYEPDPFNVKQIRANLELNGLTANVIQAAVVHDDRKSCVLNLWPKGQSWRNSIVRNKKGTIPVTVKCVNIRDILEPEICVKMDIEGSEIPILLSFPRDVPIKKLVYEWSFDVDQSTATFIKALEQIKPLFSTIKYPQQVHRIQKWDFFPPAAMIHCFNS